MSSSDSAALNTRSDRIPNLLAGVAVAAGLSVAVGGLALKVLNNPPSWLRIRNLSTETCSQIYTTSGIALIGIALLLRSSAVQRPDSRAGFTGVEPDVGTTEAALDDFDAQGDRADSLHELMRANIGWAASKLLASKALSQTEIESDQPEVRAKICRLAAYVTLLKSEISMEGCGELLTPIRGLDLQDSSELTKPGRKPPIPLYVQVSGEGESALHIYLEDDAFGAWNEPVRGLSAKRAIDELGKSPELVKAIVQGDEESLKEFEAEARKSLRAKAKKRKGTNEGRELKEKAREGVCLTTLIAMGRQIEKRYYGRFTIRFSLEDGLILQDRKVASARGDDGFGHCADMEQLILQGMRAGKAFLDKRTPLTKKEVDDYPRWYLQALQDQATLEAIMHLTTKEDAKGGFYVLLGSRVVAKCRPIPNVKENDSDEEPGPFYPGNAVLPIVGTRDAQVLVETKERIEALSSPELRQLRLKLMEEALDAKGEEKPAFSEEVAEISTCVRLIREWWDRPGGYDRYIQHALPKVYGVERIVAKMGQAAGKSFLMDEPDGEWVPDWTSLKRRGVADIVEPAPMHYRREEWGEIGLSAEIPRDIVLAKLAARGTIYDTPSFHECIFEALANGVFTNPSSEKKPRLVKALRALVADDILAREEEWMERVTGQNVPGISYVQYEADEGKRRIFNRRFHTNINGLGVRLPLGIALTKKYRRTAVQKFASGVRRGNIWGGEETLEAASKKFGRPTWVYDLRSGMSLVKLSEDHRVLPTVRYGSQAPGQPIELIRISDIHFKVLRAW